VIAISTPEKNLAVYVGRVNGSITKKPMIGQHGFGWDSIFIPEGHNKSFAQFKPEEKDKISHRKKALNKFLKDVKRLSRMLT